MKRRFGILIFLLVGFTSAICFAQINEPRLTELNNQEGGISLNYPEGWHVQQGKTPTGFRALITPERPDSKGFAPIVFDVIKYQKASVSMGLTKGTPEEKLNMYLAAFLTNTQGKELSQEPIQFGKNSGKLIEVEGLDPSGSVRHLFVAVALKDDVLATIFCEAPAEQFESYRNLFKNIITKVNPFAFNSTP